MLASPALAQIACSRVPAPHRPRARIAIEETLDAPIAFLTEPRPPAAMPVAARITVPIAALADAADVDALDARATALLARDVRLWLAVETPPPDANGLEAWTAAIAALSDPLRDAPRLARADDSRRPASRGSRRSR